MTSATPFQAVKISENVYWVGAIDWDLIEFHGYRTERGTTYNAFLVMADKITLIDTVKKRYKREFLSRIQSVIDPKDIDIIVSNHAEMDHSGLLPDMVELIQPEKLYASANGAKALAEHFGDAVEVEAVDNGGSISLGNMNLTFVETKMIHWPDSMVSFLDSDGILFSQDAFGMHLATSSVFAEDNDRYIMQHEAEKYYANIVLPYSKIVGKTLDALQSMNLPIQIIAPDHGPIWRGDDDIAFVLDLYQRFVAQPPTPAAVVLYDTMWESTDIMAKAVAEGLRQGGVRVQVFNLHTSHRSDVATAVMNSGALVVGSPTLNSGIYPTLADALTYIKGLQPMNLIGAFFGSYGWNQKGMKELGEFVDKIGMDIVAEPLSVKFVPTDEDLEACATLGRTVAGKLSE
jgi:flavorubredoxin